MSDLFGTPQDSQAIARTDSGTSTHEQHDYIDVALPVPLFHTFTYRINRKRHSNPVVAGSRVVVPFRQRRMVGVVLNANGSAPAKGKIRDVLEVPDPEPALSPQMIALCRWISDYYVVPVGGVVRATLPTLLSGAGTPTPARRKRRMVSIIDDLPTLLKRDKIFSRSPQQRAAFELIESLGGSSSVEHLKDQLGISESVIKGLEKKALIEIYEEEVDRDPFARRKRQAEHRHQPTPAQNDAIKTITSGIPGDVFLLHGITGSGKTLVYIEILREIVFKRNQSAIVLVPEIALTPQTVDRFRSVFGDTVAVLHSALSDGERYDAWLGLKRGDKKIAVGARSAIFAPMQNLGAIIVDEEHETSYKQGESPRYHARETSIVRAREEGAVVVLGSATPSLESWVNATSGKYRLLTLSDRVGGGELPKVEVVDLRRTPEEMAASYDLYRNTITEPLDNAIRETLAKKQQVILLLNRRGYSSFIQCDNCGHVENCPDCSIALTHHRAPERLVCHYCMHTEESQSRCSKCSGVLLQQRGLGTQQVEKLIGDRFPSARIARMDIDTTTGKWAHADILDRVGRGEIDILLGTQMIAKGLDFPNVTLVGVVDADVGINLPDFRASERCFQLLSQVAGRAGRGPLGGEVIIQTRDPQNHAIRSALMHDYTAFITDEIERRSSPAYPPVNRLASIVFSGLTDQATADLAMNATSWLSRLLSATGVRGIQIVGPAKRPIERIKTRWRWHTLLKSDHSQELTKISRYFMEKYVVPKDSNQLRISLDRDPVTLL